MKDWGSQGEQRPQHDKKRRPVGAGLSLDKFATAGTSKYDKRLVLEKLRKEKLIKYSKLNRIKHRLEAQGALKPVEFRDAVGELEELEQRGLKVPDADTNAVVAAAEANGRQGLPSTSGRPHSTIPRQERAPGSSGAAPEPGQQAQHQQRGQKRGASDERGKGGGGNDAGVAVPLPPLQRHQQQQQQRDGSSAGELQNPPKKMRVGQHGGLGPAAAGDQGPDGGRGREAGGGGGPAHHTHAAGRYSKPVPSVQRLAHKVAAEREEQQRAREEAAKAREARQKHIAEVEKARKEEKQRYFKRNAKGQPLMRYRMEKLLAQIEQG